MLSSALGNTDQARDRVLAIEAALREKFPSTSEEYRSKIRAATFTMEGDKGKRLRSKVMKKVVLPEDFVAKGVAELRTIGSL
ncbi:unnamed protein product [Chrysoparadoxa australica]